MWSILAARSAAWASCALSVLMFGVALCVARRRGQAIRRLTSTLQETEERANFAIAAAQTSGKDLQVLRLAHRKLSSECTDLQSELARCRSRLASARTALTQREGPSDGDGEPTMYLELDDLPASGSDSA